MVQHLHGVWILSGILLSTRTLPGVLDVSHTHTRPSDVAALLTAPQLVVFFSYLSLTESTVVLTWGIIVLIYDFLKIPFKVCLYMGGREEEREYLSSHGAFLRCLWWVAVRQAGAGSWEFHGVSCVGGRKPGRWVTCGLSGPLGGSWIESQAEPELDLAFWCEMSLPQAGILSVPQDPAQELP